VTRLSSNASTAAATEVATTLDGPTPKSLRAGDQSAFWANLGVSLLGFTGASAVLIPTGGHPLSLTAALTATVVGTVLGSIMLGLSAVPGARTGAPAMVVLRGLFGARLSVVPTLLNVLQMLGWGTFELLAIAEGARVVFGGGPHWLYVLAAGVITVLMTIWPLGALRVLRRYVTVAVAIALVYLFVQLLQRPIPADTGSWHGFWFGADTALAVAVSFIPLASDFSRHARSARGAFTAATIGYSVAQILCYAVGLLALVQAGNMNDPYHPFVAVPLGAVFFGVIVLREVDQSFANVYSTTMSTQNLLPRMDRRVVSVVIGVVCTALALLMDISQYANFLTLIGSVFVPMFGVLAADYFLRGWRNWDTSQRAPSRWSMLLAWLLGLVTYQLINPGMVGGWSAWWTWAAGAISFTPAPWMSASVFSFLVAAALAWLFGLRRSVPARD
jgi:putative hydroxymethylpyrimidine transporter CytX